MTANMPINGWEVGAEYWPTSPYAVRYFCVECGTEYTHDGMRYGKACANCGAYNKSRIGDGIVCHKPRGRWYGTSNVRRVVWVDVESQDEFFKQCAVHNAPPPRLPKKPSDAAKKLFGHWPWMIGITALVLLAKWLFGTLTTESESRVLYSIEYPCQTQYVSRSHGKYPRAYFKHTTKQGYTYTSGWRIGSGKYKDIVADIGQRFSVTCYEQHVYQDGVITVNHWTSKPQFDWE